MNDATTTLFDIRERVARYVDERGWSQFHTYPVEKVRGRAIKYTDLG